MNKPQVYIVVTVPQDAVETVLSAIAEAGGGVIGEYTHCAFTSPGVGRFKPSDAANPHLGDKGAINQVDEWRIETFCPRDRARAVVHAIRLAHPYEEPLIYTMALLDEDAL